MTADFLALETVSVRLSGRAIVQDLSVSLPRGCLAALVGPNGAGKTTLLKAIAGLLPFEGSVRVDGRSVSEMPIRERATRLSYLPQGHVVYWPLPVRDVVALGRYPHGATDPARLGERDASAVIRAMADADVTAFADRRVTDLSGGERSRVALARALAVEAPIVLADEPIASLDPRHQLDVMRLLRRVADAGTLVVVVTHDLGLTARFADRVLVLSGGRLAAHGTPQEALTDLVLAEVFKIGAYRARVGEAEIIVPWSEA
ncbi:ABC transporter [Afipia sp. P52-10]|uniref:ABC transporter ATP-binding protein n=1 Tax=Afipia sp. P52-10 TaxID=1429916 RepID=UPI0003DF1207|nr:ABC transporter ATP-binding protein [Afipia sp. P52-10]ETR76266.1 ABC transporter [Afipia sp. P52-10]